MTSVNDVLNCPIETRDCDATTIREYLVELLYTLWEEGEGFSSKRPFGNSGWEYDLYHALCFNGLVECEIREFDDDGDIHKEVWSFDKPKAIDLIREAIASFCKGETK